MENDDIEKAIQDLKDSFDKIDIDRIEAFFVDNYPDKWKKLSKEKKLSVLKEFKGFMNSPQNKSEIRKVKEKLDNFMNIKLNIEILFLGVLLGVSGNLVANLLDRYFIHFGFYYDIIALVIFFLSLFYIYHVFIKKSEKEIVKNKTFIDLNTKINNFEQE